MQTLKKKNPLHFKLQIYLYILGYSEMSTSMSCIVEKI